MCGIVGSVGDVPSEAARTRALADLQHRGPDDTGQVQLTCQGHRLWLGHTRLAILDLSEAGHQPMQSQDGRWWITFNGEIYNHADLRSGLNVRWRGHSDTETLLEALAAWGLAATLAKLNGMFAFAAFDMETGAAYLARDPFGVKPVYYSTCEDVFSFASEIKVLAGLTGRKFPLDQTALQTFLSLRFVPSPHTLLDGVRRVPPGHFLRWDIHTKAVQLQCYIQPATHRFAGSLDDAVDQYHERMGKAVSRNMLSDVPVGVLLSGGIDSAYVAAMAARQSVDTPCFTVGFGPGFPECELEEAAQSAKLLGLRVHPLQVTHDDLWSVFESCIAAIEEPLGTTSVLPMWALAKHTRQEVKVVLTGQGSDEPWGGYRRYQAELWRDLPLVTGLTRMLAPILEKLPGVPDHIARAADSLPIADMSLRFEREYGLFSATQRAQLTGRSDASGAIDAIRYWLDWSALPTDADGAEKMMRIDCRMGLADDLLLYGDKISMAHSLEARVPMLDLELVRFVESLPRNFRVTLGRAKIAHKLASRKYLPHDIVYRKKKAFHMPFSHWIRTNWRKRVQAVLFETGAPHLRWLNKAGLLRIWDEHQSNRRDWGRQLFALLAFAFWCRAMADCVDSAAAKPVP